MSYDLSHDTIITCSHSSVIIPYCPPTNRFRSFVKNLMHCSSLFLSQRWLFNSFTNHLWSSAVNPGTLQPVMTNTSTCLPQKPPFPLLLLLHIFLSPRSSSRNHRRASHFSLGEILMSLQGPSRSNYVEQLLSLTGPRLPGENTNLPGKQNSPTFDKTLDTQGYK